MATLLHIVFILSGYHFYTFVYCKHFPVRSWFISDYITIVTRRMSPVEQELLTLPEHLNSPRYLVGFVLFIF